MRPPADRIPPNPGQCSNKIRSVAYAKEKTYSIEIRRTVPSPALKNSPFVRHCSHGLREFHSLSRHISTHHRTVQRRHRVQRVEAKIRQQRQVEVEQQFIPHYRINILKKREDPV